MTKQDYIEANGTHISDDSLAAIEQIPENAWAAVQAAADLIDASNIGLDCEVAATHETIEDFQKSRNKHWAERGQTLTATLDGRAWKNIQIAKGQRRQSLAVIDCGEIRIALTA